MEEACLVGVGGSAGSAAGAQQDEESLELDQHSVPRQLATVLATNGIKLGIV